MTSKQVSLNPEPRGNPAQAGARKGVRVATEGVLTEEQAFYEAQEQGFAALRARNQARTRRKP